MTPLLDILKYFSKYPAKQAVLDCFSRESSADKVAGYTELKAWANTLAETSYMPNVETFVFSSDETKVVKEVRNIKGLFMLLEYGNIDISSPDQMKLRERSWRLAITFGFPQKRAGVDFMSEALIMDQLYQLAFQLQTQIKTDNKEICDWLQMMDGSLNISPVEPKLLYENYGVVVDFANKIYPQ